ncbi:MAG: hypothetical protein JWQ34_1314 [Mucilaginibacter sp.]|uniref:hypothetical protein n=1 Tax=Mucilaginibacter sp. TaxID=1882438 RepID=UPI00261591BA|nr:hypothetical protein [Mucilaginibacter sp.]MDB5003089.1 hypothetical protein [Mucilaginibacter sp.]
MKRFLLPTLLIILSFAACKPAVSPESLYGKWKYIKVRHPNSDSRDSVSTTTLQLEKPYIEFTNTDSLIINWDGWVLSHGTFKIDGRNIQYKEILADGKTREFPFYIEDLQDKQLIFSTKGTDGSEVTAAKQ